ncbi:MAG: hypothetical protein ACE144_17780 [Thermodesulfobacteriota bacterium]
MKNLLRFLFIVSGLLALTACALRPCTVRLTEGIAYLEPESDQYVNHHKRTVQGKIDYVEKLGGYIIKSETQPAEVRIVNQDRDLLEELYRRGENLIFEGHFTVGVDRFFIQKIGPGQEKKP